MKKELITLDYDATSQIVAAKDHKFLIHSKYRNSIFYKFDGLINPLNH